MASKAADTCVSPFCLPPTIQMEEFSRAFIHAIASVAGYGVENVRIDLDSVDLRITQYATQHSFPIKQALRVQAKCTYAQKPKKGNLPYKLSVKNYNDLRHKNCEPRILVVVHVPDNVEDWLNQTDEFIALHHCGYWQSLEGMPATKNKRTKTIRMPIEHRFTVDRLKRIMEVLATEEKPNLNEIV